VHENCNGGGCRVPELTRKREEEKRREKKRREEKRREDKRSEAKRRRRRKAKGMLESIVLC
jgi:hypothetical protein